MARNEFQPGHPVVFWVVILGLIFGLYSGLLAGSTIGGCEDRGYPGQHWNAWPPGWVCDNR